MSALDCESNLDERGCVVIRRWGPWSVRIPLGEHIDEIQLVYDPEADYVYFEFRDVREPWFDDYLATKMQTRSGSEVGRSEAIAWIRGLP